MNFEERVAQISSYMDYIRDHGREIDDQIGWALDLLDIDLQELSGSVLSLLRDESC